MRLKKSWKMHLCTLIIYREFDKWKFLVLAISIHCTYITKKYEWKNKTLTQVSQQMLLYFNDLPLFSQHNPRSWRGRLQHFLQLLCNQKIQKVILIWFVHLLKSNKFSEFHRCGSKNVPATPIFILNFPRAWQSF